MSARKKDDLSFLEHLEELRWHILRSVLVILIFAIAAFIAKTIVFDYLIFAPRHPEFVTYKFMCWLSGELNMGDKLCMVPAEFKIQNLALMEEFMTHIKVSIILGFILAFPYILWEVWRFVKPGMYVREIKRTRGFVFFCSLLFILGISFAYLVIIPFSMNFLVNYSIGGTEFTAVADEYSLSSYIGYISMIVLAAGIIFELPVLVYFLSKLGLVTPAFLKKYRKHSVILILFLSAMITPPDVTSQLLIALPVFGLYQLGISISKRVYKNQAKRDAALDTT